MIMKVIQSNNKVSHKRALMSILLLFITVITFARLVVHPYDFSEANDDGVMLYYHYLDSNRCEVVPGPEKYKGVITIPSKANHERFSVVGIGVMSFQSCHELEELYLPNTLQYIDTLAFSHCDNLRKVNVGNSLELIADEAFCDCTELSSINIPQSLKYVGFWAFVGCTKLLEPLYNDKFFFYYPAERIEDEGQTYVVPDGIETIGVSAFNSSYISKVVLPQSLRTISDYAFMRSLIQEMDMPDSLDSIGYRPFFEMGLRKAVLPASIKKVGNDVFYRCGMLREVDIKAPWDCIPAMFFAGCSSLKEVTYPETVHKICEGAFSTCDSLRHLPDLSHIDTIEYAAFARCSVLESISIPSNVVEISEGAFAICAMLKHVELDNGIRTIGNMAFGYCPSLGSIVIPPSVTYIGNGAFRDCGRLKDVYVNWQTPLSLDSEIIDKEHLDLGVTLHVPPGTVELYTNAPFWCNFTCITDDMSGIGAIDNTYVKTRKFNLQGRPIHGSPKHGVYILNGKKVMK